MLDRGNNMSNWNPNSMSMIFWKNNISEEQKSINNCVLINIYVLKEQKEKS